MFLKDRVTLKIGVIEVTLKIVMAAENPAFPSQK